MRSASRSRCGDELTLVLAPEPNADVQLHTEIERARPLSGGPGMRVFKCPYCQDASMTYEPSLLLGVPEERQYIWTCAACGRDYVRDLR